MDGNFSAVNLQHQNAGLDRYISNGSLYMVGETKYQLHLSCTEEIPEVRFHSICNSLHTHINIGVNV